jgi:glycosyltransferase involved in cell wall biosynthesis
MIKILHMVYSGVGGTSAVVFSLIEADKKKLNHSIIFSGPEFIKDYKNKCKKLKINYNWIKTKKFIYFNSFFLIFKNIKKFKPNVIFIHNFYTIHCIFYKFFFPNVKLFYISHTPLNLIKWKDKIIKYFHKYLDKIIFLNKDSLIYFKKKFNLIPKNTCLITNGINHDFFSQTFHNDKKIKNFRIGMACRVNRSKYYDLIANSLNSNVLKNLNIEFQLAGDGEDLNNFRIRIKKMGLQNKIKIIGYLNEIKLRKWYKTLDLYIQASAGEGMSISLLQAMSMEVPVIGSRVPGINNILGKSYIGLLFNNNVRDLSEKIKFFYFLNKNEKKKFSRYQRKYVILKHSYKSMFEKYFYEIRSAIK